ncbi:hypothetical protein NVP3058O_040 [Vibrio phage 3.058.O._10N.286.46.B8]|nr:hypothetical protein NVP2058O_041 [Vibrio phage 2.058.O._10N.286.46.B8]AUS03110.1 hypothetical protein NVP3058O_040 [Vibrio phage 3.058.O._10N.286.46.B8]
MDVTLEQLKEDIATAASVACEGFFEPDTIISDIELELEVGSVLDSEQLAKFKEILMTGEGLHNTDGYDYSSTGLKLERHDNDVFDVYWDELVECLEDDNEVE